MLTDIARIVAVMTVGAIIGAAIGAAIGASMGRAHGQEVVVVHGAVLEPDGTLVPIGGTVITYPDVVVVAPSQPASPGQEYWPPAEDGGQ